MNVISEGLNAITDNAGQWKTTQTKDHAQCLRIDMDDIEASVADLTANANWAIELLAKNAKPFNHEFTCQHRLVEAIGRVRRAMEGNS